MDKDEDLIVPLVFCFNCGADLETLYLPTENMYALYCPNCEGSPSQNPREIPSQDSYCSRGPKSEPKSLYPQDLRAKLLL